ncbi:MAG: 5-formyltetrahydrofolate cyclo-ligase [Ruminococcus sp.]|nr:5-formyltetrahydrofolate cyclo-ligase [Ruminococcus sp.]
MPVKNLKQKKNEIRSKYKKLRDNLPSDKKAEADNAIAERLLSLPEYESAEVVLAFVSKDIEVDTRRIISKSLKNGKKVAVPRCNVEETTIDYYFITSYDDLESGYYGLLEPNPEKCEKLHSFEGALCVVPGLVFDREGYRIGFGKGYYDRFIIDFSGVTVGVCYSRCIEDKLPRGFYDRPIDIVITERYMIDIRKG